MHIEVNEERIKIEHINNYIENSNERREMYAYFRNAYVSCKSVCYNSHCDSGDFRACPPLKMVERKIRILLCI